jgi:putative transposase
MKILRAYKTELDVNNVQNTLLLKHAGTARFAYNWGLSEKKKAFDAKEKTPNAIELHRRLNAMKSTEFPWMYEVSKCAAQESLRNLDRAFDNFFRKCKLKKQGKFKGKVGFPQFKSKAKGIGSFRLTGTIKVELNRIQLPRLGWLKLKEKDYLPINAKILSATVEEKAGRWFVSIQVEQDHVVPVKKDNSIVGVDLGIKSLAVCSDGVVYDNPKALRNKLDQLKRLQRHLSRKQKGSNNRKKVARKIAQLHFHIANIRKDVLHKITTALTKTKSVVVIEDLNVSGMLKNHCLAQAIQDVGLGEFRRQLSYKGEWYNCKIIVVDRFFPSSKMCSVCGMLNDNLTLADRSWRCECGAVHDRDGNASINLENYGRKVVASSVKTINSPMETKALTLA